MTLQQIVGTFLGGWMIFALIHLIAVFALMGATRRSQLKIHGLLFIIYCGLYIWVSIAACLLTS